MHEHGPKCLEGPVRGTPGWWTELGKLDAMTDDALPSRKRSKNRRAAAREKQPAMRMELVARVRREIAAGTYDTPARWEAALDRLLDHLTSE